MNKRRLMAVVLFVLLLCITLIGCNSEKTDNKANSLEMTLSTTLQTNISTTQQANISTTSTTKSLSTTTKKIIDTTKKKDNETTSKSSSSTTKIIKASSTTTDVLTTTRKAVIDPNDEVKPPSRSTTNATTKSTTTSKVVDTCTITIECKNILDNMDNLKAGHNKYVPKNGYILKDYKYQIKQDDTVYDVVKNACEASDITLTSRESVYGMYIVGFNNIDEKDCGKYSGWMYSVNGKKPSFACSKYDVKNGDEIVFFFSCEP